LSNILADPNYDKTSTRQASCTLPEYGVETHHNYHSTAEHSCQEGRTFSWNRRHFSIWPWRRCYY